MPNRVQGEQVKEVFETDLTATQLEPFITDAHNVIQDNLVGITNEPGAATLKSIERWLSAHFASAWDPRTVEEGPARGKFEGPGLADTTYGQRAIALDPTGILAGLDATAGGGRTAFVSHMGGDAEALD